MSNPQSDLDGKHPARVAMAGERLTLGKVIDRIDRARVQLMPHVGKTMNVSDVIGLLGALTIRIALPDEERRDD